MKSSIFLRLGIIIALIGLTGCTNVSPSSSAGPVSLSEFAHQNLLRSCPGNRCGEAYKLWLSARQLEREIFLAEAFKDIIPDIDLPDVCLSCPTGDPDPQPNFPIDGLSIQDQIDIAEELRRELESSSVQSLKQLDLDINALRGKVK